MSYSPLPAEKEPATEIPPYSSTSSFEERAHPFYEPSVRRKHPHHKHGKPSVTKAVVGTAVGALAVFGVFSMGRMYENYSYHNAMLAISEHHQVSGLNHGGFRPEGHGPHGGDDKWWMKFHEGESPEEAEAKHNEWLASHPHHGPGGPKGRPPKGPKPPKHHKGDHHHDDDSDDGSDDDEPPSDSEPSAEPSAAPSAEPSKDLDGEVKVEDIDPENPPKWMKFHKGQSLEEAVQKHNEWVSKHPHGKPPKGKGQGKGQGQKDGKWWMKFHKGESPEEAEKKHQEWINSHPEEAKEHGFKVEDEKKPEEKKVDEHKPEEKKVDEQKTEEAANALI